MFNFFFTFCLSAVSPPPPPVRRWDKRTRSRSLRL